MAAQCLLDTVELESDCSDSASVHEPSNQKFKLWEIKRKDALQRSSAGLYRIHFPEVQLIGMRILKIGIRPPNKYFPVMDLGRMAFSLFELYFSF